MVGPFNLFKPRRGTVGGQITGVSLMGDNQVKSLIPSPMIIGWATGPSDVENTAALDKPRKNTKKSDEDVVHVSKH